MRPLRIVGDAEVLRAAGEGEVTWHVDAVKPLGDPAQLRSLSQLLRVPYDGGPALPGHTFMSVGVGGVPRDAIPTDVPLQHIPQLGDVLWIQSQMGQLPLDQPPPPPPDTPPPLPANQAASPTVLMEAKDRPASPAPADVTSPLRMLSEREIARRKMVAFYRRCFPEKIGQVEKILARYPGKESRVIDTLAAKYPFWNWDFIPDDETEEGIRRARSRTPRSPRGGAGWGRPSSPLRPPSPPLVPTHPRLAASPSPTPQALPNPTPPNTTQHSPLKTHRPPPLVSTTSPPPSRSSTPAKNAVPADGIPATRMSSVLSVSVPPDATSAGDTPRRTRYILDMQWEVRDGRAVITDVVPGSLAAKAGFIPGMQLLHTDIVREIKSEDDLELALRGLLQNHGGVLRVAKPPSTASPRGVRGRLTRAVLLQWGSQGGSSEAVFRSLQRRGHAPGGIKLVSEAFEGTQPTVESIDAGLRWLVADAFPGDSFLLHISGEPRWDVDRVLQLLCTLPVGCVLVVVADTDDSFLPLGYSLVPVGDGGLDWRLREDHPIATTAAGIEGKIVVLAGVGEPPATVGAAFADGSLFGEDEATSMYGLAMALHRNVGMATSLSCNRYFSPKEAVALWCTAEERRKGLLALEKKLSTQRSLVESLEARRNLPHEAARVVS